MEREIPTREREREKEHHDAYEEGNDGTQKVFK